VITGAGLAVGLPLLSSHPGPDLGLAEIGSVVGANLAVCALSATMGAAIGALVRNQIVGVVVLLVVNFAVVPLVAGSQEALMNLTPFGASAVLSGMSHDTTVTIVGAGVIVAGWTLMLGFAALVSERQRDLA
jgi:hypothetical protein